MSAVFDPLTYGAVGNGTTDDTTAMQSCFAAAITAQGIVDFGNLNFKTTSAITVNGAVKMRGSAGYTKGGIVNAASDIFTVANGANSVSVENCSFTANTGAGHIFNASGASISRWTFNGCWLQQVNAAKGIWYQYQGGALDILFDDNCFLQCATAASVAPMSFLAMPGNCNSIKFGRGRYTGGTSMTVPFFVFYPDSGARTDTTAVGMTAASNTVTDANAVAGDLGLRVYSSNFTGGSAVITAVTPGTGYTVGTAATATLAAQTCLIGLQGWYEEIKFDHCTFEVMPAGAIYGNGLFDVTIDDVACWDITATQDVYHFYKGVTGYPCQGVKVRGGRGGAVSGANNFYADANCRNILLESFAQGWGGVPVVSSPAGQTTIINGVGTGGTGTPVSQFPS